MDDYGRSGHEHRSRHSHHKDRHHHSRPPIHHRRSSQNHQPVAHESPGQPPPPSSQIHKDKNFKLLIDPCLVKGTKKVYRYDGIVPGEPSWNVNSVKDPRTCIPRRWTRQEVIDLPVPRFKIDQNYVGDPPEVEIFISNINDNIDRNFLADLVGKHGEIEEVVIFYHPVTKKHGGFARVVFVEVASALNCIDVLHKRSVMGKQLNVTLDPLGRIWVRTVDNIVAPKKDLTEPVSSDEDFDDDNSKSNDTKKREKVDDRCSSPFSNKMAACNPPAETSQPPPVFPHPPPSTITLPDFNRPPPPLGVQTEWPVQNQWQPRPPDWGQWGNGPAPNFMAPPPPMSAPVSAPPPQEKEPTLDLDTRIELLLKGSLNGMAPPFLAMDMTTEEAEASPAVEERKPATSRSSSVSEDDDRDSPPPLPPGVDLSPGNSPLAPPAPITDYCSDKYLPLSTPPSPFLTEEEYLESLLAWRLKHLSYVHELEERESKTNKKLESDKVSEISSEEHEEDFGKNGKDDDRMSLSSLSSTNENIQEVTAPSNLYGSYTYTRGVPEPSTSIPQKMIPYGHQIWPHYAGYPTYPQQGILPFNPLHPPPGMYHPHLHHPPPGVFGHDPVTVNVDRAMDRLCELLTAILEKDLMKRMTEALAFTEFEYWWEYEEKYYNRRLKEPEKPKDAPKEEVEEKINTAENLLATIADSNFEGMMSSGLGLGFRAALPKMPSFRRKPRQPSPSRVRVSSRVETKRNESDEEEMVQLSDSESQGVEAMSMMGKKRRDSESSQASSGSESSGLSSAESESSRSDSEDEGPKKTAKERKNLVDVLDEKLLEEYRAKTPEGRSTPTADEDFSEVEEEDVKKSREPSPSGSRDLRKYAMEALVALGLDEFVADVKIREGAKRIEKPKVKERLPKPIVSKKIPEAPVSKKEKPKEDTKPVAPSPKKAEIPSPKKVPIDKPLEIDVADNGDSEATLSPPQNLISVEHSYSLPTPPAPPETKEEPKPKVASWALDHDYGTKATSKPPPVRERAVQSTVKERKRKSEKLVSHLLDTYLKKPRKQPAKTYPVREPIKEMENCYEFLTKGVDLEDIKYFQSAFEGMVKDEQHSYWLKNMHWSSYPETNIATPKNIRGNETGCARTQGYYKLDAEEKMRMKHHFRRNMAPSDAVQASAEAKQASREARSMQRRLLTAFSAVTDSDLLKFNQLKFRKKLLKFGKSEIHDWGLFANEPIAADEMVIEYVGQKVRPFLADYREQKYMKKGIGSSYLFRIDLENIIDATYCGNLSRFINHSCNPNCYAKIITIEGEKKIVIYSKRDIAIDEEITYDYKFPLEDEKIRCLCGELQCKGFLN